MTLTTLTFVPNEECDSLYIWTINCNILILNLSHVLAVCRSLVESLNEEKTSSLKPVE